LYPASNFHFRSTGQGLVCIFVSAATIHSPACLLAGKAKTLTGNRTVAQMYALVFFFRKVGGNLL